jgi:hypothetical protein
VEAGGATGRIADAADTERGLRLTLITRGGLRLLLLDEGTEVRLTDPGLAARVARAAEALAAARSGDTRGVEIQLRADRAREVGIAYVAGAPLWKPSWRLVVPGTDAPAGAEARLQGWAVVDNRSGADWERVRLTLVSGEAAAFRQPLYTAIRVPRPELPVRVAEALNIRPDTGARPAPPPPPAPLALPAPAPAAIAGSIAEMVPAGRGRAVMPSDAAAPAAPALAAASAGRVAFLLPEPVSIRSGETANVPFLDVRLPAERIWWVQDLSARHPLQAVRLRNGTSETLPDGIVTVYGRDGAEAGGFLGDAEIRALPPGDSRIVAFARDRDVLLTHAAHSQDRPERVELRAGLIVLHVQRREEAAIAVDPKGARGKLVIDLARRPGATPRFDVAAEGDFGLRHEAMLDGQATTLRLGFERQVRQEVPLYDRGLGDIALLRWREFDVEQSLRRLPGGPGTLETLRDILARLPEGAPGRASLAAVVQDMQEVRRLLEDVRARLRALRTAEAALTRARAAAEDRTGPEREEARRRLNRASLEVEQAGAAADQAWEAWQRAVRTLVNREG